MLKCSTPHEDRRRTSGFGRSLTDSRIAAGMTQHQLSSRISQILGRDINQGRVCEWETGQRAPRQDETAALEQIVGPLPPVNA